MYNQESETVTKAEAVTVKTVVDEINDLNGESIFLTHDPVDRQTSANDYLDTSLRENGRDSIALGDTVSVAMSFETTDPNEDLQAVFDDYEKDAIRALHVRVGGVARQDTALVSGGCNELA